MTEEACHTSIHTLHCKRPSTGKAVNAGGLSLCHSLGRRNRMKYVHRYISFNKNSLCPDINYLIGDPVQSNLNWWCRSGYPVSSTALRIGTLDEVHSASLRFCSDLLCSLDTAHNFCDVWNCIAVYVKVHTSVCVTVYSGVSENV